MAYHDSLTGLANRLKMNQEIERVMQLVEDEADHEAAMLMIDLDNFKKVNDTLGHDVGDALLVRFSELLKNCVRDTDVVGRLVGRMGGDEFIILLPAPAGNAAGISQKVCERIMQKMQEPMHIGSVDILKKFKVTASIGVAVAPEAAQDAVSLFKYADIAMYHAKRNGKNQYCVFSPEMEEESVVSA